MFINLHLEISVLVKQKYLIFRWATLSNCATDEYILHITSGWLLCHSDDSWLLMEITHHFAAAKEIYEFISFAKMICDEEKKMR